MATRRISHSKTKNMVWAIALVPRSKLGSQTAIPSMHKAAARRPTDTLGRRGNKSELIGKKVDRH
jgi:hypothetical protein